MITKHDFLELEVSSPSKNLDNPVEGNGKMGVREADYRRQLKLLPEPTVMQFEKKKKKTPNFSR